VRRARRRRISRRGEAECPSVLQRDRTRPAPLPSSGQDSPIDISRCRPLVLRRRWPDTALGPSPRNTALLADPGFILPPELFGRADGECRLDRCQPGSVQESDIYARQSLTKMECQTPGFSPVAWSADFAVAGSPQDMCKSRIQKLIKRSSILRFVA
jgi:hypothetical protein